MAHIAVASSHRSRLVLPLLLLPGMSVLACKDAEPTPAWVEPAGGVISQFDGGERVDGVGQCMDYDLAFEAIEPGSTWSMCLASYDTAGIAWSRTFLGGGVSPGPVLTQVPQGVVFAGGTIAAMDLGGGEIAAPASGEIRSIVAALDDHGEHRWSTGWGYGSPLGIGADEDGDLVVQVLAWDSYDYGGGPVAGPGLHLVGLDADGGYRWARGLSGAGSACLDVTCGSQAQVTPAGRTVVMGSIPSEGIDLGDGLLDGPEYNGTHGPNGVALFLASYDADGGLLWSRRIATRSQEGRWGDRLQAASMALDADGNVYVVGEFVGLVDLGSATLASEGWIGDPGYEAGVPEGFLVSWDRDGELRWSRRFGPEQTPESYVGDSARSVAVDPAGHVLVTGVHTGTSPLDFGAGPFACGGDGGASAEATFVASFESGGAVRWSRCFQDANGTAIAADGHGAFLLGGFAYGPVDFGDTRYEGLGGGFVARLPQP